MVSSAPLRRVGEPCRRALVLGLLVLAGLMVYLSHRAPAPRPPSLLVDPAAIARMVEERQSYVPPKREKSYNFTGMSCPRRYFPAPLSVSQ